MADFELIPAIDLLDGSCVRLSQGRYDEATVYGEDPGAMAASFAQQSIKRLHVVDLDGAKAGKTLNEAAIRAIVAAVGGDFPIQLGGGIRTLENVSTVLDLGVERAILGTIALRDPALVRAAAAQYPGQIVVGIDARDGMVAVEGWLDTSEAKASDLARSFEDAGVAAIVYTDIARDGMLSGPNLESTVALASGISIPVIVSGGVSSVADIEACAREAGAGIAGVIAGRAIYTGDVKISDALAAIERVSQASRD